MPALPEPPKCSVIRLMLRMIPVFDPHRRCGWRILADARLASFLHLRRSFDSGANVMVELCPMSAPSFDGRLSHTRHGPTPPSCTSPLSASYFLDKLGVLGDAQLLSAPIHGPNERDVARPHLHNDPVSSLVRPKLKDQNDRAWQHSKSASPNT